MEEKVMEYEHTPKEMAEKLIEFIRDFSDDKEELKNEVEHVAKLFDKLQNSNEFDILVNYLDVMFMNRVFDIMGD